jgi:hypothetical protein
MEEIIVNNERMNISKFYGLFLNSFTNTKDDLGNYRNCEISYEIYYQLFKIRNYVRNFSRIFNRNINHSISNIFQDIVAYYFRTFLDKKYTIILEEKRGIYVPDIIIKKNNINYFIIELKTNLGYCRNLIKEPHKLEERIESMSKTFHVNKENIIYILETHGNAGKAFLDKYYDKKNINTKKSSKR